MCFHFSGREKEFIYMKTKHKRAYKYRFYPTDGQKRVRTDAYCQHGEKLYAHDLPARLTTLQQQPDYAWLAEASRVPPQQALQNLDKAFKIFLQGVRNTPSSRNDPCMACAPANTSNYWRVQSASSQQRTDGNGQDANALVSHPLARCHAS
jgi:hypothetical protein